ncbi:Uncharacterized protein TCM_030138 [Theobroma cacao]|uniref:Uncharacterized protein n=1 Tax=Theobroma cacao TaxID=3641 RepID=A0A061GGN0_THECC|nr:Uncharacterized protein TCM_030138 [Theobroma cacao]
MYCWTKTWLPRYQISAWQGFFVKIRIQLTLKELWEHMDTWLQNMQWRDFSL